MNMCMIEINIYIDVDRYIQGFYAYQYTGLWLVVKVWANGVLAVIL